MTMQKTDTDTQVICQYNAASKICVSIQMPNHAMKHSTQLLFPQLYFANDCSISTKSGMTFYT